MPVPLRRLLPEHDITVAGERGWGRLTNGELLTAAQLEGFQVFITADKNLAYQQNLSGREMAIIVLPTQVMTILRDGIEPLRRAIECARQGSYQDVDLPRPSLVRRPPPDRGRP